MWGDMMTEATKGVGETRVGRGRINQGGGQVRGR